MVQYQKKLKDLTNDKSFQEIVNHSEECSMHKNNLQYLLAYAIKHKVFPAWRLLVSFEVVLEKDLHFQKLQALGYSNTRTLTGHKRYVRIMSLAPDGKTLITYCGEFKLVVWDIETFREVKRPEFTNG